MQYQLVLADKSHIEILSQWFTDEAALKIWSGPNFRYPYTAQSFYQDLKPDELTSFAMLDENEQFVAFGQYYVRRNHCHLGRLIVNPANRGQGLAKHLLMLLCQQGSNALALDKFSLFVIADNKPAIASYKKFGFEFDQYPEPIEMENCLYMTKSGLID